MEDMLMGREQGKEKGESAAPSQLRNVSEHPKAAAVVCCL